jgi:hypothetical protein
MEEAGIQHLRQSYERPGIDKKSPAPRKGRLPMIFSEGDKYKINKGWRPFGNFPTIKTAHMGVVPAF